MRLSELQQKEIIDICSGKKVGIIIDASVNREGKIEGLVLEERRGPKRLIRNVKDELVIEWNKIMKIGDDTILINTDKR